MEIKKSKSVDIERERSKIFLVAAICICSFFYVAYEWHVYVEEPDIDKILDDMEQDLDLEKMKEKTEMIAAISEEEPHDVATTTREVQEVETVQQVQEEKPVETIETTTNEIIVNEEKPEVQEAKIEEVVVQQVQEDSQVAEETHYKTVVELPEFPGGHSAFIQWINTNVKYPANAIKKNVQGKILITFIIDETGAVKDIVLKQKLDFDIDNMVMRAFMNMPAWKPGKDTDGNPCKAMVAVPIHFEI